ncbi:MAG: glucuronate isomerase [Christensenellaceae bacterium]|jgi:glucuronate isomerase|nr:glucuronate isomerase [Christensenellaceae bacterium]
MSGFISAEFLLNTAAARRLYHEYAEGLPVLDYHCHVSPQEIAEDTRFLSISALWLGGDHYKWRLMRAAGVDEALITGSAPDDEKFLAYASVLPKAVGNPLYHWSHLELKRYFGYDGPLNAETAREVFTHCNAMLRGEGFSARGLIERSKVEFIGTTDDPLDSLAFHGILAGERGKGGFSPLVTPTFRPDKAVNIEKPGFADYIHALCGEEAPSLNGVMAALRGHLQRFTALGCRSSDHGLDALCFAPCTQAQAEEILQKALAGEALTALEQAQYKTALLLFLGEAVFEEGLVMQLHFGVQRNANQRMFAFLGPDAGFDVMASPDISLALSGLLNALDQKGSLPKTIVYSLNPNDNAVIDSIIGAFQGGGEMRVQHGSAWWFNDTKEGILSQLGSFAQSGVLGCFVGMLTDSRSFLSYTRHEYFRRLLCRLLGKWLEEGELFADYAALGGLVRDLSYGNAKRFFAL